MPFITPVERKNSHVSHIQALRYLHNRSGKKKRFWVHIRLTCRPSTLKMRNISSTALNAKYEDGLERCTTGIRRVLMEVSRTSCTLYNNIASHSSQVPISCILLAQALQTSRQKNAIWLVTCIRGRSQNIRLWAKPNKSRKCSRDRKKSG